MIRLICNIVFMTCFLAMLTPFMVFAGLLEISNLWVAVSICGLVGMLMLFAILDRLEEK